MDRFANEPADSECPAGGMMGGRWTETQIQFLRDNWSTLSDREVGVKIGRSREVVAAKRRSFGLAKQRGHGHEPKMADSAILEVVERYRLITARDLGRLTGLGRGWVRQRLATITRRPELRPGREVGRIQFASNVFRGKLGNPNENWYYVNEEAATKEIIRRLRSTQDSQVDGGFDYDIDISRKRSLTFALRSALPPTMFETVRDAYVQRRA